MVAVAAPPPQVRQMCVAQHDLKKYERTDAQRAQTAHDERRERGRTASERETDDDLAAGDQLSGHSEREGPQMAPGLGEHIDVEGRCRKATCISTSGGLRERSSGTCKEEESRFP